MGYSWDNFLKPSSTTDTNIQIMDNNGVVTYTINPYAILNVLVNNNLLKISLKSGKVIIIQFSSINESKLALPRIKALIDSLTSKTPNFITNNVKNYVQSVVGVFFYQDVFSPLPQDCTRRTSNRKLFVRESGTHRFCVLS